MPEHSIAVTTARAAAELEGVNRGPHGEPTFEYAVGIPQEAYYRLFSGGHLVLKW